MKKYEVKHFWLPNKEEKTEIVEMIEEGWEFVAEIDEHVIFRKPL